MTFLQAEILITGDALTGGRRESEINRDIKRQLTAAGIFMQSPLAQATPFGVTGEFRRSWVSQIREEGSTMSAVVFPGATEYALAVELGRKAAPVPIEPLTRWVRRKLQVTDEKRARGIAFYLSKKKAKKPTKGQEFAKKTFEANVSTLNQNFLDPIGAKIVQSLSS